MKLPPWENVNYKTAVPLLGKLCGCPGWSVSGAGGRRVTLLETTYVGCRVTAPGPVLSVLMGLASALCQRLSPWDFYRSSVTSPGTSSRCWGRHRPVSSLLLWEVAKETCLGECGKKY